MATTTTTTLPPCPCVGCAYDEERDYNDYGYCPRHAEHGCEAYAAWSKRTGCKLESEPYCPAGTALCLING